MNSGYLWLLGILWLTLSNHSAACHLRFAAENDFPPHLIQTPNQQWQGQSVELLQALASRVGCSLEFRSSPWLRSLAQLKTGELDVISHLYRTPAREQEYYFIGPHHQEAIWLIGRREFFETAPTLADTPNLVPTPRIAVLNGAYYGDAFAALSQQPRFAAQLVPISSIQDKLALLNAGRVDAILEDRSVLGYWQQHHAKQAEQYRPIWLIYQAPVYFGFSKKSISPSQFQQLQQAWQQLEQTHQIQAIQQRYQPALSPNTID